MTCVWYWDWHRLAFLMFHWLNFFVQYKLQVSHSGFLSWGGGFSKLLCQCPVMHSPWASPVKCFESHSPFKTQTEMWTCVISQNIQEEKQISKREPCAHMGGLCCPRISLYIWKTQLCYLEAHVHWTPVKPILQISRCPHARNRDAKARTKIAS